jgi:hypothetical protein
MNNGFRWDVLFAPYCGGHGANFPIDVHDVELVSTRSFHWNYVESENVAGLVGTFHMHFDNLVAVLEILGTKTYLERGTSDSSHMRRLSVCMPYRSHHILQRR